MEKTLPLEERSIKQIFLESQETMTYIIPIYQRNYAWEEYQITALIKDVFDSCIKDPNTPYYLGTLVTYKHGDSKYEIIDGQQRLTTIYMVLKALGYQKIRNKLTYSARNLSASTLDGYPHFDEEVDEGIRNGYKYVEKAISMIDNERKKTFSRYFCENVKIIHYSVPKDVDLNHYFEVMNSRGEQLEKHEIVKSMLSQHLNKTEMATFNHVWEACSEMNQYIQQVFTDTNVFGKKLNKFNIKKFKDISVNDESEGKETIANLIKQPISKIEVISSIEQNDKFQPIIDFPNFLLIVLKTTMMNFEGFDPIEFTLDDKELLNEFEKAIKLVENKGEFAKVFAFNLLKAKFFLDNYIVHHSLYDKEQIGDNPWKLQYYQSEGYPVNLVGQEAQDIQDELVHLLSMFEVTFTPNQRKNYLFYCMMYLFSTEEPSGMDYLQFLQDLANKYFYDVYLNHEYLNEKKQPIPHAFDNAILANGEVDVSNIGNEKNNYKKTFEAIYEQGKSDIPLFVFNYTDYILWKKYAVTLRGDKSNKKTKERIDFFEALGCEDFGLLTFKNFYFSRTRKSLEHYYPQAKAGEGKPLSSDEINCFGNFAMIGTEANSSGSNWDPKTKLDHYIDGKSDQVSVASLKFRIMMQVCQDNYRAMLKGELIRNAGMEWNAEDMYAHQKKILDIIIR